MKYLIHICAVYVMACVASAYWIGKLYITFTSVNYAGALRENIYLLSP